MITVYDKDDISIILRHYDPLNVRTWPYYPITLPLLQGEGPVSEQDCDEITYEVWDQLCNSHGSYEYLPDAINEALRLTKELLHVSS
jgi:hypothetical protein